MSDTGGALGGAPTGLVLALLGEFASDMRESKSINQLSLSSGKAYANVHAAATQLLAENILIKETIGHSHRCRLNLANDKTLLYISLLQTLKRDELLKAEPQLQQLLLTIDNHSARSGVLLAWHRGDDLLLVTTQAIAIPSLGVPTAVLPLAAFLADHGLRATIGRHTLLFGHALYASLLRESPRRIEVQR